jgi:hypothetical protein
MLARATGLAFLADAPAEEFWARERVRRPPGRSARPSAILQP